MYPLKYSTTGNFLLPAMKNVINLIRAIKPDGINLPEFRARYPITPPRTALHTAETRQKFHFIQEKI